MQLQTIVHTIPPLYDSESRVLLLGSIPSPKSREVGFFYGHPQNRFWRVLAAVLGEEVPVSIEDKRALCLRHHVALWGHHRQMRYCGRVRHVYPQRRAERHRQTAPREQNYAYFCHRRQVGAAVPQTHRAENRRTHHAAALHQSRERRMVAREADRSVPRYSLIRGVFFTSKELFPNAALKKLILPLVIEQVLAITVGLADTMMVSSVGEAAVSGVSLVDMLNVLIINIFFRTCDRRRCRGRAAARCEKKNDRACDASKQLYLVVTVIALIISALVMLFRAPLLRLLFGTIEDDVQSALTYLTVSVFSYPVLAIYNAGAALFRAQGNSRISMLIAD